MDAQQEFNLALQALAQKNYAAAKHHLNAASVAGVDRRQVQDIEFRIEQAEHLSHEHSQKFVVGALAFAGVAYLILSARSPGDWMLPLWALLAFLLVPAVEGILIAKGARDEDTAGQRFWRAWLIGAATMGVYTLWNLVLLNSRINTHNNVGDIPLVIFTLVLLYGAIAGVVAGIASAVSRRTSS